MLEITLPERTFFKESTNEFLYFDKIDLKLEHSLISLSKWESKTQKPFLSVEKDKKLLDLYIECMNLNNHVDPMIFKTLPQNVYSKVTDYINEPMTATTIKDIDGKTDKSVITSEIIYYYMIKLGIPFECQKWHLNRLITLIRVCSIKDGPQKKMSKREILEQNRRLNAQRRQKAKTKG